MSRKKLLLVTIVALAAPAAVLFGVVLFGSPALFRMWVNQAVGAENLQVSWRSIDAPIFRPLVVHDMTIRSRAGAPIFVAVDIPRASFAFRLAGIWDPSRGRALRELSIENVRVEIRQPALAASATHPSWRHLARLIADNLNITFADVRFTRGGISIAAHDGTLTASELEAGRFHARDFTLTSPWFAKTFGELKGATSWEYDRLTIGAVSLLPGLDLDAVTIDVAHLREDRVGIETALDVFGGKVRANIGTSSAAWEVAGSATQISLAQVSEALSIANRATGSIRSAKFTFRGDPADFAEATVSLWAEANDFTWRDRTADTIVFGASLSNRQIQVDQLYLKQRENQLTLNGESPLPRKVGEWPDFRGDVSASIKDLGEFARLFGGRAAEFSGQIEVNGNVTEREHRFSGQLTALGQSLVVFGAPVDTLRGQFRLSGSSLEVQQCELRHGADSASAAGVLELGNRHAFVGKTSLAIADLAAYGKLLDLTGGQLRPQGTLQLDADFRPDVSAFHLHGRGLRLAEHDWLPQFNADAEATYSAGKFFAPSIALITDQLSFTTSAGVAADYVHLHALRLDLRGHPILSGEIFLPLIVPAHPLTESWFSGIVPDAHYNVDLQLAEINLAELAAGFSPVSRVAGKAAGRLQIYGTSENPEERLTLHGVNVAVNGKPPLAIDVESSSAEGVLSLRTNIAGPGVPPIAASLSLPFAYQPDEHAYRVSVEAPLSATLHFPKLALASLPQSYSENNRIDGAVASDLSISGTWQNPAITGRAEIVQLQFPGFPAISGQFDFAGQKATIRSGRVSANREAIGFQAEAAFADGAEGASLHLTFDQPLAIDLPSQENACVDAIRVRSDPPTGAHQESRELTIGAAVFLTPDLHLNFQPASIGTESLSLPVCESGSEHAEPLTIHLGR